MENDKTPTDRKTQRQPLTALTPNAANPRSISKDKIDRLVESLLIFPQMLNLRPIVVDGRNTVLGGNMRLRALGAIAQMTPEELADRLGRVRGYKSKKKAEKEYLQQYWAAFLENPAAPVVNADGLTDAQVKEFIIKDNVAFGSWDWDELANGWDSEDLADWGLDVWQSQDAEGGQDGVEGSEAVEGGKSGAGSLAARFIVPPFSVLDSRQGYWVERKRAWTERLKERHGESREKTCFKSPAINYMALYKKSKAERARLGVSFEEYLQKYVPEEEKRKAEEAASASGASLFDPVLAEVLCRWFTPGEGSAIFDCMAGDTRKGAVFGYLGHRFTGIELRKEQVEINERNLEGLGLDVRYICDDGRNVERHIEPESQDLFFSCPPYFNLEVYSDEEADASNQKSYKDFLAILEQAFSASIRCLKQDRFAVVVVGDIRNKKTGAYYGFPDDVKQIFRKNGLDIYNEMVFVEQTGGLVIRAARHMQYRKVAKNHQNILVFFKGDTKRIKAIFPDLGEIMPTEEREEGTERDDTTKEAE